MRCFLSFWARRFTVASVWAGWRRFVVRPAVAAVVPFFGFPACWSVLATASRLRLGMVPGASFDFIFGRVPPFSLGVAFMTGSMGSVRKSPQSCMTSMRSSTKSSVRYAATTLSWEWAIAASATSLEISGVRPDQLRKLDLIPCGTARSPTLWSKSQSSWRKCVLRCLEAEGK